MRKLDHGVMVCYILQPEWVDMIQHMNKKKRGEKVEHVNEDWKKQDHITREIEEAIEGLYNISVPVDDIATMVGVGKVRVREYISDHGLVRVHIRREKKKGLVTLADLIKARNGELTMTKNGEKVAVKIPKLQVSKRKVKETRKKGKKV